MPPGIVAYEPPGPFRANATCHNTVLRAINACVRGSSMSALPDRVGFVDAVATLFQTRYHLLYRYLDRLTGDPDLAMDLAQGTFVRLYRRGAMPDDPQAWLTTVATNLLRDHRRRSRRRGELIARWVAGPVLGSSPPAADAAVLADEARMQIRTAFNTLSPRDRQLLILRHEDCSYREIATVVGVAKGSVGTLLARAARAFRAALPDRIDRETEASQRRGRDAPD
jgi:RNA polymerase sigma-70 factor (ECF subfamily)